VPHGARGGGDAQRPLSRFDKEGNLSAQGRFSGKNRYLYRFDSFQKDVAAVFDNNLVAVLQQPSPDNFRQGSRHRRHGAHAAGIPGTGHFHGDGRSRSMHQVGLHGEGELGVGGNIKLKLPPRLPEQLLHLPGQRLGKAFPGTAIQRSLSLTLTEKVLKRLPPAAWR